MLKLSDFDYYLPKELIAQFPMKERDKCRLMVIDRAKAVIEHKFFHEITDYLKKDDLLVLNDTKVLPCRILGKRPTGGRVEVLLLGRKDGLTFNALMKPARVKINDQILFNGGSIKARKTSRNTISFEAPDEESIYSLGSMPLPPYIKREASDEDKIYYQTVYAKKDGAVAAPTAGLHFTKSLIDKIHSCGVNLAYVTLHVGIGTFKPVQSEDVISHKMEPEYFDIPEGSRALINRTKASNGRLVAVGTTSLRALEASVKEGDKGNTSLFIYPGYRFNLCDSLLTNFHLPKTTLFMLVCAFAGEELINKAYEQAVENKYRFYSYGDAMLII